MLRETVERERLAKPSCPARAVLRKRAEKPFTGWVRIHSTDGTVLSNYK
jgi:hypothetical protein